MASESKCVLSSTSVGYYARCCADTSPCTIPVEQLDERSNSASVNRPVDYSEGAIDDSASIDHGSAKMFLGLESRASLIVNEPRAGIVAVDSLSIMWETSATTDCESFDLYLYYNDTEGLRYSGQPLDIGLPPEHAGALKNGHNFHFEWKIPPLVPSNLNYVILVTCHFMVPSQKVVRCLLFCSPITISIYLSTLVYLQLSPYSNHFMNRRASRTFLASSII